MFERCLLQLADAFACDAEPVAGFAERVSLMAVEAEAQVQDGPQAWVQAFERPGETFAIVTGLGERERRGGGAVAETVEQTVVLSFAKTSSHSVDDGRCSRDRPRNV